MRTKVKILQHNRLDANSFVSVKMWKLTENHQYFEGSNKNFRDRAKTQPGLWQRWQQTVTMTTNINNRISIVINISTEIKTQLLKQT